MGQDGLDVTAITRSTYDHIAPGYAQKIKGLVSDTWIGDFEKSLLDTLVKTLTALIGDPVLILDIGCGHGKDTFYLSQKNGVTAIGLDYSLGMLTEARKDFPGINFVQTDMRSLPFPEICFDGIWANGCVYHVPKRDFKRVLLEVRRVLKASGVFSFNFKLGTGERLEQNPKSYGGRPRFYSYYQVDEMRESVVQAGLRVINIQPYPEAVFGEGISHIQVSKV